MRNSIDIFEFFVGMFHMLVSYLFFVVLIALSSNSFFFSKTSMCKNYYQRTYIES